MARLARISFASALARLVVGVAGAVLAVVLGLAGVERLRGPAARLSELSGAPQGGRVHASGVVAGDSAWPPLCRVELEVLDRCGKAACWVVDEAFTTPGAIELADPSGKRLRLEPGWAFAPPEPDDPGFARVVEGPRRGRWEAEARKLGPTWIRPDRTSRVRERCAPEGTRVFVSGCTSPTGALRRCDADTPYLLVPGDGTARNAVGAIGDRALAMFAAAALALSGVLLALFPAREPLALGLAQKSRRRPASRLRWAVPGALVATALVCGGLLLSRGQRDDIAARRTYGYDGHVVAVLAACGLGLVAWLALSRRQRLSAALEPIEGTRPTTLADARSATVELAVRAKAPAEPIASLHDGRPLAYREITLTERYAVSTGTADMPPVTLRSAPTITIHDASGEGRIDATNAILDVETHSLTLAKLPPDLRRVHHAHADSRAFLVTERGIAPEEPLFVLGEVRAIEMSPGAGYREVRGAPTVGGEGYPVIVHAGTERGLVARLAKEASGVTLIATAALGLVALLGAITAWLTTL